MANNDGLPRRNCRFLLLGLELNISVLSAALRGEPTGQAFGFRGDVASVAKRNLRAGEMLDGEGGHTVWGKLVPAAASLKAGALPIGLAHRLKLKHDVAHGEIVRWTDVEFDANNETIKTRRAMRESMRRRVGRFAMQHKGAALGPRIDRPQRRKFIVAVIASLACRSRGARRRNRTRCTPLRSSPGRPASSRDIHDRAPVILEEGA